MPIHIMNIIWDNKNSLHSSSDVTAIVHPILAQKSGYCIVMQNQKHTGNLIPTHSTHFQSICVKFKDAPISVSANRKLDINGIGKKVTDIYRFNVIQCKDSVSIQREKEK